MELICKNCGGSRDKGRRLCRPCNLERLKAVLASRPRYMWNKECIACRCSYEAWRKTQKICSTCYKELTRLRSLKKSASRYVSTRIPGQLEHREIAKKILGRNLDKNEVIHHIDNNPVNNSHSNLLLLSSRNHVSLHQYLDLQRLIFEKSDTEDPEITWDALLLPLTLEWLKENGIPYQIMSEV